MNSDYWQNVLNSRVTRRRGLIAVGGGATGAAFLAACGGSSDNASGSKGTSSNATTADDKDQGTPKVGGKLIWQGYGDPGAGLELIKTRNGGVYQLASLTHDALMDFAQGQPKY